MSRSSGREFEKISKEYDRGRSAENVELWSDETMRLAKLNVDSLVLDLGCGTGIYAIGISDRTKASLCGLDPVPGMLRQAMEKSKAIPWICAVGERMPFRSGIFSCVFASQVWHHIVDRQLAADECFRVIGHSGKLVVRTISHDQLRGKTVFRYFPEILDNQLRVYPSKGEFDRFFEIAGFESVEHHTYNLERYQSPFELIEAAEKKLWSMFRPITEEGLRKGIEDLKRFQNNNPGKLLRNDETITLVVASKV